MKHCKFLNTALDRLTFHQQGITEPFGFLVLDSRKTLKNLQLCVSYSRIAALVYIINTFIFLIDKFIFFLF